MTAHLSDSWLSHHLVGRMPKVIGEKDQARSKRQPHQPGCDAGGRADHGINAKRRHSCRTARHRELSGEGYLLGEYHSVASRRSSGPRDSLLYGWDNRAISWWQVGW